ncbi:MAG: NAD-dependent epimerase/dehydratase family protein [Anaerolineae bacterium]|jgi:threonine 3-dehydrogenase|nr:NAD-dependent epimerase/dehydratase family protein [Anaerolineae bacterium]MBT7189810.1 NAD-dependent epimerase/dehydratase family protein [Anaerolineae bacterium]MBT7988690.1 NAD-dependent epimerase/dehydratase family protein [Anaerolineae bacterium]
MRRKATLITGAAGEVGQALVERIAEENNTHVISMDIKPLPPELDKKVQHIVGDILDEALFARLVSEFDITHIYHLAALLSTRAEYSPMLAHNVNVGGTMRLLQLAAEQSSWKREPVIFIFPSSVAAFGMDTLKNKAAHPRPEEWEWNKPITMYGCNKLYGETLGIYYSNHYQQLAENEPTMLDFRCVRYPGLISAFTVPSGGTSDYGPEMLHAAAQGKPYESFVREDAAISFMAMPDAVTSVIQLANAPRENLSRQIYNITAFSLSAEEFAGYVKKHFPDAEITYAPDVNRQRIIDSWPIDMNDDAARRDWGWKPEFDAEKAFSEYLVPNIRKRYEK